MKRLTIAALLSAATIASAFAASDRVVAPSVVCRGDAFSDTCYDRNRNVAPISSGLVLKPTESAEAVRLMHPDVYGDCRNFTGHLPPTQNWALLDRFRECRRAAR